MKESGSHTATKQRPGKKYARKKRAVSKGMTLLFRMYFGWIPYCDQGHELVKYTLRSCEANVVPRPYRYRGITPEKGCMTQEVT